MTYARRILQSNTETVSDGKCVNHEIIEDFIRNSEDILRVLYEFKAFTQTRNYFISQWFKVAFFLLRKNNIFPEDSTRIAWPYFNMYHWFFVFRTGHTLVKATFLFEL